MTRLLSDDEVAALLQNDPAAADGTTLPSMSALRGGPPQATYPLRLSEAEMPQTLSV